MTMEIDRVSFKDHARYDRIPTIDTSVQEVRHRITRGDGRLFRDSDGKYELLYSERDIAAHFEMDDTEAVVVTVMEVSSVTGRYWKGDRFEEVNWDGN
jgi:hypothetical protein